MCNADSVSSYNCVPLLNLCCPGVYILTYSIIYYVVRRAMTRMFAVHIFERLFLKCIYFVNVVVRMRYLYGQSVPPLFSNRSYKLLYHSTMSVVSR